MVEADAPGRVTARSLLELLSTAYTVHPAFGEAEVVEIQSGLRPSFKDNLPRVIRRGKRVYVNGAYRHGFLLAPVLARMSVDLIARDVAASELVYED
jgi:glycine oxidase